MSPGYTTRATGASKTAENKGAPARQALTKAKPKYGLADATGDTGTASSVAERRDNDSDPKFEDEAASNVDDGGYEYVRLRNSFAFAQANIFVSANREASKSIDIGLQTS